MRNFIKNNIKIFATIIITAIIVGSASVYATIKLQASEIEYNDTTVDDALNILYSKLYNLTFYGTNSNNRSAWSTATNVLSTSYNLDAGKYFVVVTGNVATQDKPNVGRGTISLNIDSELLNSTYKENYIAQGTTAHLVTNTATFIVEVGESTTLTASFSSYYAMQQHIVLDVYKFES